MNIAKRQNSYVIIGENDEQLLITKNDPEDLDETIFEMDAMIFTASQNKSPSKEEIFSRGPPASDQTEQSQAKNVTYSEAQTTSTDSNYHSGSRRSSIESQEKEVSSKIGDSTAKTSNTA